MSRRITLNRYLIASLTAVLVLGGCAISDEADRDRNRERAQERLEQLLEGRTAGEPRSCISTFNSRQLQVLHRTALVYESGDTVWVSRPENPDSLNARDIVVIERRGSQLCKHDIVRLVDQGSWFHTGVVFLGDFVPYRR